MDFFEIVKLPSEYSLELSDFDSEEQWEIALKEASNKHKQKFELCDVFFKLGAAYHWYFIEALRAIECDAYLPALLSLINGLEASLRITMHQISRKEAGEDIENFSGLSDYQVFSNACLLKARGLGFPVELLSMPDESDFEQSLNSKKPNEIDVRIVALRNDVCHGNTLDFIREVPGGNDKFFVPTMLIPILKDVLNISVRWCSALVRSRENYFREAKLSSE